MKKLLLIAGLLIQWQSAAAVTLRLIDHQQSDSFGSTLPRITDGSHVSGLVPASDAKWYWDGTTLTANGLYTPLVSIGGTTTGTTLFAEQIRGLTIDTASGTASAENYSCVEGAFGADIDQSICGQYDFGGNLADDSSTTWGPGTQVSQTLGGDDTSNGPPLSITQYDFSAVSVTGTGTDPGDQITIGNSIAIGSPGAIQMTFEVVAPFARVANVSVKWALGGNHTLGPPTPFGQSRVWVSSSGGAVPLASISNDTYFTTLTSNNSTTYFNPDFAQSIDYGAPGNEQCATPLPGASAVTLRKYSCFHDNGTIVTAPIDDVGPGADATGTIIVTEALMTGTLQVQQTTDEPTGGTETSTGDGADGYNMRWADGSVWGNVWYGISQDMTLTAQLTGDFNATDWEIDGGTVGFSDPNFQCQQASPFNTLLCTPSSVGGGFSPDGSTLSWGMDRDGAGTGADMLGEIDVYDATGVTLIETLSGVLASLDVSGSGLITTYSGEYRSATGAGLCPTSIRHDGSQLTCGILRSSSFDLSGLIDNAPDIIPLDFSFTNQNGVALATQLPSNEVTITGISQPTQISVISGEYSIGAGCTGPFTDRPGTIADGESVCVRHTSAATGSTSTHTYLNVGGVVAAFSLTTSDPPDSVPDPFVFFDQSGVNRDSYRISNEVTITGINVSTPISISVGKYSLGCSNNFTSDSGSVSDGESVCVRLKSSDFSNTTTDATLTVGGVSDTFSVTTNATNLNSWGLTRIITNPSSNSPNNDQFGFALGLDANQIGIGVPYEDLELSGPDITSLGTAYLYDLFTSGFDELDTPDPFPNFNDQFGWSVSIDQDRILIGAPGEDDAGPNAGRAFIIDVFTGQELHTLDNPDPTNSNQFGYSVSISGDRALVGAPSLEFSNNKPGKAYLFDTVTGNLLHTFDNPSPNNGDGFGRAVAVYGDHIVIGAPFDHTWGSDAGIAYIFDAVSGDREFTLNPTLLNGNGQGPNFNFGSSVDVFGDVVAIGSPDHDALAFSDGLVFLFDANTGIRTYYIFNPTPDFDDEFGTSMSLSENRLVVGTPDDDFVDDEFNFFEDIGRVFIFDTTNGVRLRTIDNPYPDFNGEEENFGAQVRFSGDRLLISAPEFGETSNFSDEGRVYLYEADSDGDGIADSIETLTKDTDNDGTPDYLETDSDKNGIPDSVEVGDPLNPINFDNDNEPDFQDLDNDNDGVNDDIEIGGDPNNPLDWDLDGIPDYVDSDFQGGIGGDTVPDTLPNFGPKIADLGTWVRSPGLITVTGINEPITPSITNGQYSPNCNAFWYDNGNPIQIGNNYTLCVRQLSAFDYETSQDTILSIGNPPVTATFTTTTISDKEPDPIIFNDKDNAAQGSVQVSNTVTIAGLGPGVSVNLSIEGGEYLLDAPAVCTGNEAGFTSEPTFVANGEDICVRHTNDPASGSSTLLRVGKGYGVFSSTIDTVVNNSPDGNLLPADEDITLEDFEALNYVYRSTDDLPPFQVLGPPGQGLNVPIAISVSPGSVYSIGCFDDGPTDYSTEPGLIRSGENFCIQRVTPPEKPYDIVIVITVGDYNTTYTLRGQANANEGDAEPDSFNFNPPNETGAPLNAYSYSQAREITGITSGFTISVTDGPGEYLLNKPTCPEGDPGFTNLPGNIEEYDLVCVRHRNAGTQSTPTTTEVTIGEGVGYFTTTTTDSAPLVLTQNVASGPIVFQLRQSPAQFWSGFVASGGTPPYTFSVGGGYLQSGLTLSPTGLPLQPDTGFITGIPTDFAGKDINLTIVVTDALGATATLETTYEVKDPSYQCGVCHSR